MDTSLNSSRYLVLSLLLSIIPLWNAYPASDLPVTANGLHRLEYRTLAGRDVRSITDQPNFTSNQNIPGLIREFPPRDLGRGNLRWSASDENGISEQVAISKNGNVVAIGYSLNDERLEVRNAFAGDTLFTFPVESGNSDVAISATGEVIAYAALDSVWLFRSNGRGIPYLRFGTGGYYPGPVALSASGTCLIATGNDPQGRTNRAWGFNAVNGQLLWTVEVDAQEAFNWYGARISADGSTAVVNGKFELYVLDAATGDLIWNEPTYNTESAVEISDDGQIIVTGSLSGRVRVFHLNGEAFEELWHYTFRGAVSSWVSSVAISPDGRTVGAGTLDFFNDRYEGRFAIFETYGQGQPLWISNAYADEFSAMDFNNDGSIVAAVTWGDVGHERPDLVVHERHSRTPFYTLTTNGSLSGVSISGSGTRVIAGGKATHNRVFGRGGQAHLVELTLLGGVVSGRVTLGQGNQGISGAIIGANESPYTTLTDGQGNYALRVETDRQQEFELFASKLGVGRVARRVEITPGDSTNGINFAIFDSVGEPPTNLRASQGRPNRIELSWEPYNGRQIHQAPEFQDEVMSATGGSRATFGLTPWDHPLENAEPPYRDDTDEAESINIYRSPVANGPYSLLGSIDGNLGSYIDRTVLFPEHRYYYRITAVFANGESAYSEEVVGWVNDDFLNFDAALVSLQQLPRLDGTINGAEWGGAEYRDISDVFGYDAPDTAGTVEGWIGFSDVDDRLYIAVRYRNMAVLEENMGLGVYVDDDGDGMWTTRRDGSEGNYWGYWRNGRPDMRFRSLTGGQYIADPYFQFPNPTLAFGEHETGVEVEMSIPLGFHGTEEISVYAPERIIGLGLFAMRRDEANNPVFHGWWPQDMFSVVNEPRQFGRVHVPVTLTVPPVAPSGLRVEREGTGMMLSWVDPVIGVDSAGIRSWDGVNIYRNNDLLTSVDPGREGHFDREFQAGGGDWGGWYEYAASGYVMEDEGVFEGPLSVKVGNYLGEEPVVTEMRQDDGTAEAYYVVAFEGDDNRFATKYTIEPGTEGISVFWIDMFHRGSQPFDIWCSLDDNGQPLDGGAHYRFTPSLSEGIERFHFPGREQPHFEFDPDFGGAFWVVLNYLPETPGAPAFGVDASAQDGDINLYYTSAAGWVPFGIGQLMIRAGVGQPVNEAPDPENPLPTRFEVLANYPNPFNGRTFLPVRLPTAGSVTLSLTDLQGRVITHNRMDGLSAGEHQLPVNADGLSSGMYIATVETSGQKRRIAIHLLK